MVKDVSEKNFKEEILNSNLPVLVYFYTPWCKPYTKVYSTLRKLAEKFKGKFKCYTLNVIQGKKVAQKYDIIRTPTLMCFRKGKVHLKLSLLYQEQSLN